MAEGNAFYRAGRALLDQTVRLYYARIEVEGRERIPASGAAILVANHPNSVIDAFLILTQLTARKVNIIAKDTITRAPIWGWLVRRFGVVGVARSLEYGRQRELAHDLNKAAIAACVPRLVAGEILTIFGEGLSSDARRLHAVRKGAMRFGYAAESAAGFRLGLVWIPVGISYSAKHRIRSDVLIRVGEPFCLADLGSGSSEPKALQAGTERLQSGLQSLVVNIEREDLAPLIDCAAQFVSNPGASMRTSVNCLQRVARAIEYFNSVEPHRVAQLQQQVGAYQSRLAAEGLDEDALRTRHPGRALSAGLLGALTTGPLLVLNLYGWANSIVPRWAARLFRRLGLHRLKTSGPHGQQGQVVRTAQATCGTVGGWLGAVVAFPTQTWLVFRWVDRGWGLRPAITSAAIYAATLVPSWKLYIRYRDRFGKHVANFSIAFRFFLYGRTARRLQRRRQRVQRAVRALLSAYNSAAPAVSGVEDLQNARNIPDRSGARKTW